MKTIFNFKSLLYIAFGMGTVILMFVNFQLFLALLFAFVIIWIVWILSKNDRGFCR